MFTTLIAVLFTLVLVAGSAGPFLLHARNSEIQKIPRLDLYLSAVLSQWLLTVVGLGVVYLDRAQGFRDRFCRDAFARHPGVGGRHRGGRASGVGPGDLV